MIFNILLHLSFLNPCPSSDYISPVFIIFIVTGGKYKVSFISTRCPKVNFKINLDFQRSIGLRFKKQFKWNTPTGSVF